jgi:hypothetical protein
MNCSDFNAAISRMLLHLPSYGLRRAAVIPVPIETLQHNDADRDVRAPLPARCVLALAGSISRRLPSNNR